MNTSGHSGVLPTAHGRCYPKAMRHTWLASAILLLACGDAAGPGESDCGAGGATSLVPRVEPDDELSPLRLLRRASITLVGVPPSDEQLAEIAALPSDEERFAYVDAFIDDALDDPRFYDVTFELAKRWLSIPLVDRTADAPEYGPQQQRVLTPCADGTAHAGALHYYRDDFQSSDDACADAAVTRSLEPWWAPGTMVTLTGTAASTATTGQTHSNGNTIDIDCNGRPEGTCGCFTDAAGCWFDPGTYPGWAAFIPGNPDGQRRLLAEEPARLFAHIAWYDLPATDLILSDLSVGPSTVQAAYVSQALAGGDLSVVDDKSWWSPAKFGAARVDPHHEASDPKAWREYKPSERNTFFLADRDYHYDPRTTTEPSSGFPSAGMLTSLGFLDAYPRERLRAARALEALACEQLLPPGGDIEFNAYETDPGREGPCQHCHVRIDPAAMHFKRHGKAGSAFEGWGAEYYMPGVGKWAWDVAWRTGEYPYGGEPFAQWNKWYRPGSLMTPATEAEVAANPYALFLDALPADQTLLGEHGDGTVGPLGFAKIIVAAGAFDKCVVRRLHERVIGRDIDPTTESGYLDTLVAQFVAGGRVVRPFIKELTQSPWFRRGI